MLEMEKSEEFINITVGDKDYYKIESIINMLSNIKEIIKYISTKIEKQSYVKVEVGFTNESELKINIKVSASLMQSFIRENNIKLAEKIVEHLYNVLMLKNHLIDGICKDVIAIDKDKVDIRNINNKSYSVDRFVYEIYTEELDQYVKGMFLSYKGKRFALAYKNKNINLVECEINNMKREVYIDKNIDDKLIKSEMEVSLGIKKPDLSGNSQWEVVNLVNNKVIRVIVEDKDFLNKIHLGEILISSKTTISARVCRETYLNEFNEHIKEVYILKKVLNVSREEPVEQLIFK